MNWPKNNKAVTLIEIMVSAAIAVVMMGAVLSFYYVGNKSYSMGVSAQQLQNDASLILTKIIMGRSEPGGVFRLSEAVSYHIAGISELHFVGTDGVERWLRLDNSTSIIYRHPSASGTTEETIYSAPAGAQITLRFSVLPGAQYTGVILGIDTAITKNVFGKTISGSASTYINIRNHAV